MVEYKINYQDCYKNNFRNDVKSAVKFYLEIKDIDSRTSLENWAGFILYPQALNPFLKIMESINESKNVLVLPAFNHDEEVTHPAYLILKMPEGSYLEIAMLHVYSVD
jgi:hypothetical protein